MRFAKQLGWLVISASAAVVGCDGETEPRVVLVEVPASPPTDYGDEPEYVPSGEQRMTLGFYREQLFQPLSENALLPYRQAVQGGSWTYPAVRVQGIARDAQVEASLSLSDGTLVGQTESFESFAVSLDGWLEIQAFPVPVNPSLELDGQRGRLTVRAEDDEGRVAEKEAQITLGRI